MKRTLRWKLFKRPRFPPALAQAAPGALLAEEGVSVKVSASNVRARGLRISRSVRLASGSIVIRSDRVLAAVGRRSVLGPDGPSAATLRFAQDGVHVAVDVAALPGGETGTVELHFRGELDPALLASLGTDERPATLARDASLRAWLGGGNAVVAG